MIKKVDKEVVGVIETQGRLLRKYEEKFQEQEKEIERLKEALHMSETNVELKAAVRSFFEDFLNVQEESDSGRVFNPITISCCRSMQIEPLSKVLITMRALSGANEK